MVSNQRGQKAAYRLRIFLQEPLARVEDVNVEDLDPVPELYEDAAAAVLLHLVAGVGLDDHSVDLARFQRRHLCGGRAKRRKIDAGRTPPHLARKLLAQPVGQRPIARDADGLALEILGGLDRRILEHREHDRVGRVGHGGDAELRCALGDEGKLGAGADADIDRLRRERLLYAGAAAEADDLEIDLVLPEDPRLDADLERYELEGAHLRLADPHLRLRQRRLTEHEAESECSGDQACSRHRSLRLAFLPDACCTITARLLPRKQGAPRYGVRTLCRIRAGGYWRMPAPC